MSRSFSPEVIDKLQNYVYRLIDPRNGETFYVGRGKKNRVFNHVADAIVADDPNDKLRRIREIRASGFEVAHVIHRHGMTAEIAKQVEAALIDAYPGLTNEVGGYGSDFGVMHAEEIMHQYQAEDAVFQHRLILINVNQLATEMPLYEATRYAWRLNVRRARRAEYVLSVRKGMIIGAFRPEVWMATTRENFPGRETIHKRYGFSGTEAPLDIQNLYVGKSIPDSYCRRGAANPIKYTYQ
ncbi:MAG: hypothetical protein AAF704_04245 [Cyanobacteria bacterium P01_D01_bin.123]